MAEAIKTHEPAAEPAHSLKTPGGVAVLVLLIMLAVPAVSSWLQVLAMRSWQQNSIQVLVLLLLGVAIARSDVRETPRYKPSWAGLVLMALAGFGYLLGGLLSVKSLFWGSLLLLMAGLFWALFSFRCFYSWLGVFLFAFFLLPEIPLDLKMAISLPLQLASTQITTWLAGWQIPITASGNIFYIAGEAYEVTVACSGLHTWIGFLFAGLLWMLFERFSLKSLLAVLLAAPLLALVLNVVRLFVTALVAYHVSPDAGLAVHTNLEYLLFPLGLLLMWQAGRRLHAQ